MFQGWVVPGVQLAGGQWLRLPQSLGASQDFPPLEFQAQDKRYRELDRFEIEASMWQTNVSRQIVQKDLRDSRRFC